MARLAAALTLEEAKAEVKRAAKQRAALKRGHRFFCRHTTCDRAFSSAHGVRKHCKKQHSVWFEAIADGDV